jgi:hypothetical protein
MNYARLLFATLAAGSVPSFIKSWQAAFAVVLSAVAETYMGFGGKT